MNAAAMPDGLPTVKAQAYPVAVARMTRQPRYVPQKARRFLPRKAQLFLVSGRPIETDYLTNYDDMQDTVKRTLHDEGIPKECVLLLHSTSASGPGAIADRVGMFASWHPYDTSYVFTWIVPVKTLGGKNPMEMWPEAVPVTKKDFAEWQQPAAYDPREAPTPTNADVFRHALRHMLFVWFTDSDNRRALGRTWLRALFPFGTELARLYLRPSAPDTDHAVPLAVFHGGRGPEG